jgi:hypothetical protein
MEHQDWKPFSEKIEERDWQSWKNEGEAQAYDDPSGV